MPKIYSKRLVNAHNMVHDAFKNHYAIGHFNINNLEWTKAVLETAQSTNTPIILATSEGAIKYMGGVKVVRGICRHSDRLIHSIRLRWTHSQLNPD